MTWELFKICDILSVILAISFLIFEFYYFISGLNIMEQRQLCFRNQNWQIHQSVRAIKMEQPFINSSTAFSFHGVALAYLGMS